MSEEASEVAAHRLVVTDQSFMAEIAAFVQRRLRMVTLYLAIAATILFVASRAVDLLNHGLTRAFLLHPAVLVHAGACLTAVLLHVWLRSDRLRARGLLLADIAIAMLLNASCLLILYFSYEVGMRQQVAVLGLLLITRAAVVPSPPLRTLLVSAPAPLGVLAVQLAFGRAYTYDGRLFPPEGFAGHVIWNQVVLWLCCTLATVTSYVSFGLRRRLFEMSRVDRYTLDRRIGVGAMGEVYRAHHALMRRPVAIKIIRPEIAGRQTFERFEQEVQLTSRLTHPNTVSIFDYGQTPDGLFYYVMELLDGADLEWVVEETGPMPPARVIHVLAQACLSLEEAHRKGLVHRDIKPANLMLCRHGMQPDFVKVMDFGLVRQLSRAELESARDADEGEETQEEGITGTPLTMAPEVIRGKRVGPAADVYALGVVGYFLLTGSPAFDVSSPTEHLRAHLLDAPVPPSRRVPGVPADLEACLLDAMAKDPAERPQTAGAFRERLLRCRDAGRWTTADAEAWWAKHGDLVRAAVETGSAARPAAEAPFA